MENTNTDNKEISLREIVDKLILSGSFLEDLGLFYGKMGIVIFFFRYARTTGTTIYEDYAGELLDEIYNELNLNAPINFSNGLCGIGWGIEYLVQQGFVEGKTDEILADIDKKIMERDPRRFTDYSFETGLEGIACYAMTRLHSPRTLDYVPFDEVYWSDLKKAYKKAGKSWEDEMIGLPDNTMEKILRKYDDQEESKGEKADWRKGCKMMRI